MVSEQHLTQLEPFIDDGERTIDGYSTENEIGVLTDRRLIALTAKGRNESSTVVNSTYLDRIGGTKITRQTAPEFYEDKLVYGIVALFAAVLSFALLGSVDGEGATVVLIAVGAGLGLIGVVLLVEAYDTPDDSVTVELQTSEGTVAWRSRLDDEYAEFAETLSRTVSNAHVPEAEAQRTVGR